MSGPHRLSHLHPHHSLPFMPTHFLPMSPLTTLQVHQILWVNSWIHTLGLGGQRAGGGGQGMPTK